MNERPIFFVFDVETSGLDHNQNEILSFSARLLARDLTEISSMLQYAFPEKEVDPTAARINGYTKEAWASKYADTQENLFAQVRKFLQGNTRLIAVGHNVNFDLNFLRALFQKYNALDDFKRYVSYHSIDTLTVALMVDIAQRGLPQGSYSLSNLSDRFGISLGDKAHDVEEDVKATITLFKFLNEQIRGQLLLPAANPLERKTPFMEKRADGNWVILTGKHRDKPLEVVAADKGYLDWVLRSITDLTDDAREAVLAAKVQAACD